MKFSFLTGLTTWLWLICPFGALANKTNNAIKGNVIYYINPSTGNDNNNGTAAKTPWRTFNPVNSRQLPAGTTIMVSPGIYRSSLVITGRGTAASPVKVRFTAGTYHFYPDSAYVTQWHISNTNDVPYKDKSVAICIRNSSYVSLQSTSANIVMHGKMVETAVDHCDHVTISGMQYDYFRPTVSELLVTSVAEEYADLQISRESTYSIRDSALWWEGEGWRNQPGWYWQAFDPTTGFVVRQSFDLSKVKFVQLGNRVVRAFFPRNVGFKTGIIYQNRDVLRDCAGIFMQYSKVLLLENIRINYMHGMGVVSQFCTNIRMKELVVKPKDSTDRTCAAWADILHFSGCNGRIEVDHCYLSAANDDAVNVHGTHLRIIEKPGANILKVRFMHDQSYGFDAFMPGDSINLVQAQTLLPVETNVVTKAERLNDREMLLTLKHPVIANLQGDDVVENTTRTPSVNIHHTTITRIPTRGILTTTRRKIRIEHNRFFRVNGNAVLVADDAESWYESGPVQSMEITNNDFVECGSAVVCVQPENKQFAGPVHEHIKVNDNRFVLRPNNTKAFTARSAAHLEFRRNSITGASPASLSAVTTFQNCTDIVVDGNHK
ncbi:hypothetical protein A3860_21385 [Niastella vici]|uniref:Right handed beta helix domain-containing protein n=1 Tax=Niastella vici TaxID=1703345 RepID=A0A1V9G0C6_9BACT|nr:hypothetical protein [Niastella vici]OQP63978.1 hypothetical protein A3860_21385 [Niastella vici]